MGLRLRAELRSEMRKILSNLDQRWIQAASGEVCANLATLLTNHIDRDIQQILAWTSFFPGEVDLTKLIADELGVRKVFLPRTSTDGDMTFIAVGENWSDSVEQGQFGILEPKQDSGESFDPTLAPSTVVLVPGLAFDFEGNRLGRGKGYYDRFLASEHMAQSLKIGVCWSLQIVKQVPSESHDVSMDWVCSEQEFKRTSLVFEEEN